MKHNHCVACGTSNNLNQHHLVPRSLGGSDNENNLLTLCGLCHAKAHQVQADWRHSELTRKAMRHKQANGEYIGGGAPYGFELINGDLVENFYEQGVIQQARELRESGLSLAAVAKELDRRGIQARNGKAFAAMQVKRMVAA
jgi:hypothetical protein